MALFAKPVTDHVDPHSVDHFAGPRWFRMLVAIVYIGSLVWWVIGTKLDIAHTNKIALYAGLSALLALVLVQLVDIMWTGLWGLPSRPTQVGRREAWDRAEADQRVRQQLTIEKLADEQLQARLGAAPTGAGQSLRSV